MSDHGLALAQQKMSDAQVAQQAIDVFSHYYRQLEEGVTGFIAEDSIEPLTDPDLLSDVEVSDADASAALAKTVIIKLNGGLGTSMGMDKAKSLLPVREGKSFLDIIVDQVLSARATHDARLPLIFMNSFRTQDDTLAALAPYPDLEVDGLGLDFLQNSEPKLRADDLTPVEWPADPSMEWCPPGHGDLYTALMASGVLDKLLAAGYRYASVSNSDNLGAAPNARIAGWFAASGAPYAAEICRRTAADRKGGHLAIRKADQQLILRDTAQTAADEMHFFTDEFRHPYFHTNNLWFDLQVLRDTLVARKGILGLPLIRNSKTVDPADPCGVPDRDGHGRGDRGVRGRDGHRRRPGAVPAGQDDQRPAAAAVRRLRGGFRRSAHPGHRPGAADRPGHQVLQDDRQVLRTVPGGRPVAEGGLRADGEGRLDVRERRGRARCRVAGRSRAAEHRHLGHRHRGLIRPRVGVTNRPEHR